MFDHEINSLILQLAPTNFFGGQYSQFTVDCIVNVAKMYNNGNVKFSILPTDPRIKPVNPASIMYDRFDLCEEYISTWDKIIQESVYIFPGKSLKKFYNTDRDFKTYKINWFAYIFKKGVRISYFEENKIADVIYYGDKRGSYRNNKIKKFMPYSTKNILLGYKEPKISYAEFYKKVKHSELFNILNKCKVSLVIADKEHEDNVATFRFYEALASSALAAIDIDFDPNKELIKNETLREVLYVENMNDVKKLSNLYSKELIELQQKELKRIFNEI